MAHITADRVLESTTTTGTGALTLAGAITSFKTFASVMTSPSDTCWYALWAVDGNGNPTGNYETGLGTYSGAATLTRTTVVKSSNADAAVSLAAGTTYVCIAALAPYMLQMDKDVSCPLPVTTATNSVPSTPAANVVNLFSKLVAGEGILAYINESGLDHGLQRILALNSWESCMGGIAAPTVIGGATVAVTVTNNAISAACASTNLATSLIHTIMNTTSSAGTLATHVSAPLRFWRGNAAGLGGFTFTVRFSLLALQTGMRVFMGVADSVTPLTNVDYTTATAPGRIGLAIIASTGNWKFVNNITGSAPTVAALDANFPVNVTDVMELVIFCAPNGSSYGYRVKNLSTGNMTSGSVSGANIPAAATFLCPNMAITNQATAAVASLRFYKWTKEGDN